MRSSTTDVDGSGRPRCRPCVPAAEAARSSRSVQAARSISHCNEIAISRCSLILPVTPIIHCFTMSCDVISEIYMSISKEMLIPGCRPRKILTRGHTRAGHAACCMRLVSKSCCESECTSVPLRSQCESTPSSESG